MKFSLAIILGVASAFAQANAATGPITRYLPNIIDRVSQCSFLPFTLDKDGQKTYHAVTSHCPEVKVIAPGIAKIKVASHVFNAVLRESPDSDGDFYAVTIQYINSGESQTFPNVAAYGDILLGVLGGNTERLMQQEINPAFENNNDSNLVHSKY